jgi:mono/diheme cytochrome c family protein
MLKKTLVSAALALACCALELAPHGAHAAGAGRSFYTAAQASAGKKAYLANCASCHAADLSGVSAPPLKGDLAPYHGTQSVSEVYDYISGQMPMTAPGSLTPTTYAAILAYILQQNGHPAGAVVLTPAAAKKIEAKI